MDKSSSLGISPGHPKKYPRGSSIKAWGCPRHPRFINKSTRSFFNALYFYCFMHYVLFLERLYFLFCVYCFQKSWTPSYFTLERDTLRCTSYLLWSETRSAVLHIYFGVRHAPLFCIMFTLESDTLRCFASCVLWSETRSTCFASCVLWSETRSTCFAYERSIFIVI